jgi:hypothetical protein
MSTCKDCCHWSITDARPPIMGQCVNEHVTADWPTGAQIMESYEDSPGAPHLVTGPDFGCIHFTQQPVKSEGCPNCAAALAKYNRLEDRMARRGNFGIVPLPRKCKAHRTQPQ